MKTIRTNAAQLLREIYQDVEDKEAMSLKEWVEVESESDPDFYRWILNNPDITDFGSNLSDYENQMVSNFIQSL